MHKEFYAKKDLNRKRVFPSGQLEHKGIKDAFLDLFLDSAETGRFKRNTNPIFCSFLNGWTENGNPAKIRT